MHSTYHAVSHRPARTARPELTPQKVHTTDAVRALSMGRRNDLNTRPLASICTMVCWWHEAHRGFPVVRSISMPTFTRHQHTASQTDPHGGRLTCFLDEAPWDLARSAQHVVHTATHTYSPDEPKLQWQGERKRRTGSLLKRWHSALTREHSGVSDKERASREACISSLCIADSLDGSSSGSLAKRMPRGNDSASAMNRA